MEHNICPICGGYMGFSIKYVWGQPVIEWRCSCGYDSSQVETVTSNTTESRQALKEREK